jgi:DNA polymerase I
MPKLVLVDAYALIYRAYHAVPATLMTSRGEGVNAVFGFTAMLLEVLRKEQPEYVAMAFDIGRTFRHDDYAEYKATRPAMADDLRPQFSRVEEIVNALNIPIYRLQGYEADDVIGTLADQAVGQGVMTLIVTGDTDTLQLVQPTVNVITPGRIRFSDAKVYDMAATEERYGFAPPLVADYKALTGDTSDNIPKIPGIGEKTATKLLQEFGPVEQIYAHIDQVQPARIQQILRDHEQQARRNKHLTTIVCDVPVKLNLEDCRTRDFDREAVIALFRELEFRSLVSKLPTTVKSDKLKVESGGTAAPQPATINAYEGIELEGERSPLATEKSPGTPIFASGSGLLHLLQLAQQAVQEANIEAELVPDTSQDYATVTTSDALKKLVAELRKSQTGFAFDTETTSQDALNAQLVGISVAIEPGKAYYIPVGHRRVKPDPSPQPSPARGEGANQPSPQPSPARGEGANQPSPQPSPARGEGANQPSPPEGEGVADELFELSPGQLSVEEVREALGPLFADPNIAKAAHNAKYDIEVLNGAGFMVENLSYDTKIAAYLVGESSTELKDLAFMRLHTEMTHIEQLIGSGRNQISFDHVDVNRAAPYAAADADMTLRLREMLTPQLEEMQLLDLFNKVEMPLVPVLVEMEQNGIAVDVTALRELSQQLDIRIKAAEEQIYAMVGHEFNVGSTQQLAKVLYEERGLRGRVRTQSGYSTDKETLEQLRELDPIIDLVLEHRTLKKLKNTYVDDLAEQVSPRDGRVHTSFSQTIASTGRLSSSNPNLQNIPVRTEVGRLVRKAFIADNFSTHPLVEPPSTLMSADYSQIELRLLAVMSGEPSMLEAFREGLDIHKATAAEVMGVPLDKVTNEMRRLAKTVNFGLIYGMGVHGLVSRTSMTTQEADEFIKRYWSRYPRIRSLFDRTLTEAKERGYVMTLLGRRRYIPELNSHNAGVRQQGERMAINMPVQGTAADIIKIAMIQVQQALRESKLGAKLLLQVHDELLLELPRAEVEATSKLVCEVMERAMTLDVPLVVDVAVGDRWGEMKE